MSNVLHPIGSQPPRVYWVRRLVVVVVLVVVVLIVSVAVKALSGSGDGSAAPGPGAKPAPAGTTTGAGDAGTGSPATCATSALAVALQADGTTYPAGSSPTFTVTITNSGADPCTVDAGDAARELLVTSGSDRIWSSKDCAEEENASNLLLLAAGDAHPQTIPWARVRSAASCPTGLPEPRAGTYQATVTVGGVTSSPVVLKLG